MQRRWLLFGAVAVCALFLTLLPSSEPTMVQLRPSESLSKAVRMEGAVVTTESLYEHRGTVPSAVLGAMKDVPRSILVLDADVQPELWIGGQRLNPLPIRIPWGEARAHAWSLPSPLPNSDEPIQWSLKRSSTKHVFIYIGATRDVTNTARWINHAYTNLAAILGVVALSSAVVSAVVTSRFRARSAWTYTTVLFLVLVLASLRFLLSNSTSGWAQALDFVSFYGLAGVLCGRCWLKGSRSIGQTLNRQVVTLLLGLVALDLFDLWVLHLGLSASLRTVAALAPLFVAWHQRTRMARRRTERWGGLGFYALASLFLMLEIEWSQILSSLSGTTTMGPGLMALLHGGVLHLLVLPVWVWFLWRLSQQYQAGADPVLTDEQFHNEHQVQELARRLTIHARLHQERREAASLERQRIYRDIHDGIGSKLVALLYAVRSEKTSRATLEEAVSSSIGAMKKLIGTEDAPESRDILEALFAFCFEIEELLSESSVSFSHVLQDNLPMSLLGSTTGELVQIVRELVANSLKHSGAQHIVLRLEITDIFLRIVLEESDYRQSAAALEHKLRNAISSGQGSANLRQRAAEAGVRLFVDPQSDKRTTQLVLRLWSAATVPSSSLEADQPIPATTRR